MSEAPGGARPLRAAVDAPASGVTPLSQTAFLTVAEVAARMRVSKMTVYRLVHGGDLTAVRVGRSFRVPVHAVDDYLRAGMTDTA